MKKILIVLMFIMLGSAIIVISNTNNDLETSYIIEYQNNKNLALPDLTRSVAIEPNVFRLYNNNGITVDYNISNGFWLFNGTATTGFNMSFTNKITTGLLTAQMLEISGEVTKTYSGYFFANTTTAQGRIYYDTFLTSDNVKTKTLEKTENYNDLTFGVFNGMTFNNFKFRLQLEKGQTATPYVVPRLDPIYKDNLTYKEKQEIGMGAFNGITQILRTIGNVIEPIGDFFNGLFSLFN